MRVLCLALMLGANGVMLSCFVKGLHETDSLTATVTSAAVNFVLSAAGGFFFFQEHLPMRMAFLLHGDAAPTTSEKKKD
ncbi:hypothetical protein PInf_007546 [Phytophthora infestans]|nr:hypothetical protein PInf_007546 [Phytophthora infestans]